MQTNGLTKYNEPTLERVFDISRLDENDNEIYNATFYKSRRITRMDFYSIPGEGFVPTYTSATLTDHLHASAGFRTDYRIITKQAMRKIISTTGKRDEK